MTLWVPLFVGGPLDLETLGLSLHSLLVNPALITSHPLRFRYIVMWNRMRSQNFSTNYDEADSLKYINELNSTELSRLILTKAYIALIYNTLY